PPVDLSEFVGLEPTAETLRGVTDAIMRRLRDDLAAVRGVPAPAGPLPASRGDADPGGDLGADGDPSSDGDSGTADLGTAKRNTPVPPVEEVAS
ncbi:MAG TPA: hypothetical protein VGR21_02400, partial [Cryptosporangiaceae bacterium]|nr:hypothetical protein [Cryptosporangiaceae bacterium]